MATSSVTPGALAFVGPPHLPSLEGFSYLSIVRVQGNSAIVRKTGPDTSDDGPEFDVKLAVLRHRIVESVEAELWPGSYVGYPIAFVQSAGDSSDQWAYGLVPGYSMQDHIAQLHVRHEAQTLCVQLRSTSTVIAIDRLNYALQTGASVNSMVLNALELLDKQNQVIVACGKSRSGLPSCVTSTLLSVPYEPDQRVPLIRPDTLAIAYVRRQHIVDCELTARGKTSADVFKDPVLEEKEAAPDTRTNTVMPNVSTNDVDLTFSDSDDEGNASANTTRQAAIDLVRLQNRPLDKRARYADTDIQELFMTSDADVPTLETRADIHSSMFRPSQVESQVRNAIAHPGTLGKNAQAVLEAAQQARHTRFLSTPPVLRAAYDLSFGIRGLSLMHFRRIFEGVEAQYTTDAVNTANFGRSNSHQPANPPANIGEIVDAFDNLLYFAKCFYNTTVCDFIKTGSEFIVEYAAFARPDASTCTMLVYWINSKLGKFRSLIIASNIQAAALVGREFTRSDGHLMELYQAQQDRHVAAIVASGPTRPAPSTKQHHPREHKTAKASMVPKELLAVLPKQGNKVMCMRYLSKKGCTGPVPGKCFDPNRAHFKPLALPADAKSWIDKHFLGLASDFTPNPATGRRREEQQAFSNSVQISPREQSLGEQHQNAQASIAYTSFRRQQQQAYITFQKSQLKVSNQLEISRHRRYQQLASIYNVELSAQREVPLEGLDVDRIRADSQLARALKQPLGQFVRVFRGETAEDTRPNKDLFELPLPADATLRATTVRWNEIVRDGVKPRWKTHRPKEQQQHPSNHQTINKHLDRIRKHIAKGHREGRYLVVNADLSDLWTDIFISPIGVVEKAGSPQDVRVINDYSFPMGAAVNDFTNRCNFPDVSYNPPKDIARRIWELRIRFPGHPLLMMIGDVSGAFRHIPINADHVHTFAFHFDGFIVIDLSCGFGWCGSPAFYSVAGSLINALYESQRPPANLAPIDSSQFVGNVWCDDHTCIEIATGPRCMQADIALRKAMTTVLGPRALNEDKFTQWSTKTKALGLLWYTEKGTVSVPTQKIDKARCRIDCLLTAATCSLSSISKLVGSLRYVSTCFPAARSFYQNVQVFASTFHSPHERKGVPADVREDLVWFRAVLTVEHQFNSIPVEHFARLQTTTYYVMMDASDTGICALERQLRQYIRLQFSQDVRDGFATSMKDNSINVRELMSAVLAVTQVQHGPQKVGIVPMSACG